MAKAPCRQRPDPPRPARVVTVIHLLAVAGFALLAVASNGWNRWSLLPLLVIGALCVISTLSQSWASGHMQVSGSFLGIILATVLLGGGPGAAVGVLTDLVTWAQVREAPYYFRNNLITYAWFPLLAGLFFHAATHLSGAAAGSAGYYLWVFTAFLVALAVNFLAVAGFQCHLDGSSLRDKVREALVPLLSAELFSAVLTVASVAIAVSVGLAGLVLFAVVLLVFQYLVAELLRSKQRAEALHRKATIDELTGLINRDRLHEIVRELCGPPGTDAFAVMLIDLDRFKEINDTLGHTYGDQVLREVAERLAAALADRGTVARLGGDEFCLIAHTAEAAGLERLAGELMGCVQSPVSMEELTLEVGASIGIARYPADGQDADTLMRRADLAMYAAKDGHSGCQLFTAELDQRSARRLSVLSDFRRALDSDELVVHYQPIVDARGGRLIGAEGLVRWEHPKHGFIPPGDFIGTLEQSRLIGPLLHHVLHSAVSECAGWRRHQADVTVSVNLSARNLLDRQLPARIEELLTAYGVPPTALHLELTESMLMSDPDRSRATVKALAALGVRISVDDFGTGYSSLANLRQLPINELKIDRSFVSPMMRDESDLIIVQSTINLGHDLGLRVVAEGVEDEFTFHQLGTMGCDFIQGYHISRPMPALEFSRWVSDQLNRPVLPSPRAA